ncbi:hypothetical protein MJD09_16035, partial [bacterium]|nr:hypothetical protein [bacterium]
MGELFEHFRPGASGWIFMWALLFTAAFMVAIALERGYYIWVKSNLNSSKFMTEIRRLVKGGKYQQALELCESANDKALAKVVSEKKK